MIQKYKYSVIIPHYNSCHLLNRMLQSIPEREDIQVIVVDDKSIPEEIEALQQLTHLNLEIYFQKENKGAGAARNVGLDHVQGKWVSVVDADDIYAKNAFDVFDKYSQTDIEYLCFRVGKMNENLEILQNNDIVSDLSVRSYLKKITPASTNLLKYRNMVCRNKLVSADFIKKHSIRCEECMVNNDVFYGIQIGYYGRNFKVIPDILYYVVHEPTSITKRPRTIEREFLFYLQAQKRNGFFENIGLKKYPYYRRDYLYVFYMIKKRGLKGMINFFKYRKEHIEEVKNARLCYSSLIQKINPNLKDLIGVPI